MLRTVFLIFILVALLGIIGPSLTLSNARGAAAVQGSPDQIQSVGQ
jgi:hypothetical protein